MNAPLDVGTLEVMLKMSEALRNKLVDERAALLAQPSPLFNPRGTTPEARQLERDAFAKGLHHGAIAGARYATVSNHKKN